MATRTFVASGTRAPGTYDVTDRLPGNQDGLTWDVALTITGSQAGTTADLTVYDSADTGATWRSRGRWRAVLDGVEPVHLRLRITALRRDVRLVSVVAGGSVTFSVEGVTV